MGLAVNEEVNQQPGVADKAYVIVGGSSGLGFSAARALVSHGACLLYTSDAADE